MAGHSTTPTAHTAPVDHVAEMLACVRASGLKLTPQRMAIVRELAAGPARVVDLTVRLGLAQAAELIRAMPSTAQDDRPVGLDRTPGCHPHKRPSMRDAVASSRAAPRHPKRHRFTSIGYSAAT